MNSHPKRTYSKGNPWVSKANWCAGAKHIYYVTRDLENYARYHAMYIDFKNKADAWQLMAEVCRPIEWDGGR